MIFLRHTMKYNALTILTPTILGFSKQQLKKKDYCLFISSKYSIHFFTCKLLFNSPKHTFLFSLFLFAIKVNLVL